MAKKYKCPSCQNRVRVEVVKGAWIWGNHTIDGTPNGKICALSGQRMA
jgi:hypothetical protein